MNRSSTVTGRAMKFTAAQPNGISNYGVNYGVTELMKIKPLPQGRPIATNASTGISELLGYLD